MWYIYHCWNRNSDKAQLFQTAWFLESLMTQVSIISFNSEEVQCPIRCNPLHIIAAASGKAILGRPADFTNCASSQKPQLCAQAVQDSTTAL